MSITEQKAVFQSVPVATLVTGLVNSPDPVAKQVGGLLQTTATSGRAAYAEVKSVLKQAGYDPATTKTYLAMYQRVRREQRTRSLAGALRQLAAEPGAADLFPSRANDGTPPPNIVEFANAGARRTRAVVRGLIDSNERVAEARVNGQWVFVDEQGRFGANLVIAPGQTEAVLTVTDDTGATKERRIAVQAPATAAAAPPAVTDGRKLALMIAVDTYRNPEIPALGTPAADVAEVGRALNERLGYETRVLRNPTKAQIADALRKLGREVTEQDQVMVYYAGHGYELAETGTGYWLPSDAETTSARNWVSNNDIARFLNRMPAKQVMLVSDSCYSGAFTKEQKLDAASRAKTGEELRQRRSVMALSSGGDEPVADGETNSPFATALMARIRALPRESGGFELYEQVREDVTRDVPQTPQYGVIKAAGYDEGGDYVLSPKASTATN
ncbi:caspase family protein [Azospirillum griseum]|uniref:Caspase family protein n=2 Tax=Azospirillum griseum TaxID=2496639 RepID=A0A431VMG2_9PROT|nr:caspase family protein [Azospirillum griseum]